MRMGECIGCQDFPCQGVEHGAYVVPDIEVNPDLISIKNLLLGTACLSWRQPKVARKAGCGARAALDISEQACYNGPGARLKVPALLPTTTWQAAL